MPKEAKEKKATTRKPSVRRTKKAAAAAPSVEHIEVRAYFLHLEEPWADAHQNWVRAERELTAV